MRFEDRVICPHCGTRWSVTPQHMGVRIHCANCGHYFVIPPPLPESSTTGGKAEASDSPPAFSVGTSDWSAQIRKSLKSKKLPRGKPTTLIAFAMLACTLLLPFGMFTMGAIAFATYDYGQHMGGDLYMKSDARGLPDLKPKANRDDERIALTLSVAIVFAFMPYLFVMGLLSVAYFAFRTAGA